MQNGIATTRNLITGMALIAAVVVWLWIATASDAITTGPNAYRVALPDVTGLKIGNPVRVRGAIKGTVTEMRVVGDNAELTLTLDRNIRLHAGAAVRLRAKTILGGRYVEIAAGDPNAAVIPPGATLAAASQAISPGEVVAFAERALPADGALLTEAEQLLKLVDGFKASLPPAELIAKARKTAEGLSRLGGNLARTRALLAKTTDIDAQRLEALVARIDRITMRLDDIQHALATALEAFDGRVSDSGAQLEDHLDGLSTTLEQSAEAQARLLERLEQALRVLIVFDEVFVRQILQSEGISAMSPAAKKAVEKRIEKLEAQKGNEP